MSVVNACILYKAAATGQQLSMIQFRERITASLLPLEQTPNIPRNVQHQNPQRVLSEREGPKKTTRHACKFCHKEARRQYSRDVASRHVLHSLP